MISIGVYIHVHVWAFLYQWELPSSYDMYEYIDEMRYSGKQGA